MSRNSKFNIQIHENLMDLEHFKIINSFQQVKARENDIEKINYETLHWLKFTDIHICTTNLNIILHILKKVKVKTIT